MTLRDLIAACPLGHVRDPRLDAHDLSSFSINAAGIADEIAVGSGFGERPSQVMPGVWYLARTPTKRSLFIALGRDSVLVPGLIAALRATEHNLPITLIGPAVAATELCRFAEDKSIDRFCEDLLIRNVFGGGEPLALVPACFNQVERHLPAVAIRISAREHSVDGA